MIFLANGGLIGKEGGEEVQKGEGGVGEARTGRREGREDGRGA